MDPLSLENNANCAEPEPCSQSNPVYTHKLDEYTLVDTYDKRPPTIAQLIEMGILFD